MSRRAVVTGGAGFVGSHVADAFLDVGYEVMVIDDLSTGLAENVPAAADLVVLNICAMRGAAVMEAIAGYGADVVCHLAAQSSVTVSVSEPWSDAVSNVLGTLHVLEAATLVDARVVFASSGGALYGDGAPLPTPETYPVAPLSPYGASKVAAEAYVGAWGRRYGLRNVVLRLGNVYGPRQRSDGEAGVVAIFSDRIRRGISPVIYGDGTARRDYVHVEDVAQAFLAAVVSASPSPRGVYNIGTGSWTATGDVLHLLQEAAGTSLEPVFEPLRPGELEASALNSDLARGLGWAARIDVLDGIPATYRALAG